MSYLRRTTAESMYTAWKIIRMKRKLTEVGDTRETHGGSVLAEEATVVLLAKELLQPSIGRPLTMAETRPGETQTVDTLHLEGRNY